MSRTSVLQFGKLPFISPSPKAEPETDSNKILLPDYDIPEFSTCPKYTRPDHRQSRLSSSRDSLMAFVNVLPRSGKRLSVAMSNVLLRPISAPSKRRSRFSYSSSRLSSNTSVHSQNALSMTSDNSSTSEEEGSESCIDTPPPPIPNHAARAMWRTHLNTWIPPPGGHDHDLNKPQLSVGLAYHVRQVLGTTFEEADTSILADWEKRRSLTRASVLASHAIRPLSI